MRTYLAIGLSSGVTYITEEGLTLNIEYNIILRREEVCIFNELRAFYKVDSWPTRISLAII